MNQALPSDEALSQLILKAMIAFNASTAEKALRDLGDRTPADHKSSRVRSLRRSRTCARL